MDQELNIWPATIKLLDNNIREMVRPWHIEKNLAESPEA